MTFKILRKPAVATGHAGKLAAGQQHFINFGQNVKFTAAPSVHISLAAFNATTPPDAPLNAVINLDETSVSTTGFSMSVGSNSGSKLIEVNIYWMAIGEG